MFSGAGGCRCLVSLCVKADVACHSGVGGVGHLWPPSPHTGYALSGDGVGGVGHSWPPTPHMHSLLSLHTGMIVCGGLVVVVCSQFLCLPCSPRPPHTLHTQVNNRVW